MSRGAEQDHERDAEEQWRRPSLADAEAPHGHGGAAPVFYFLGLRGLPVSVASAVSNASVVVTVVLSAIFLHQPLGRTRGAGLALTLLGATLLTLSTGELMEARFFQRHGRWSP
jgi:hypothetical protein